MKLTGHGLANGTRLKCKVGKLNQIRSSYKGSFAGHMCLLYLEVKSSNYRDGGDTKSWVQRKKSEKRASELKKKKERERQIPSSLLIQRNGIVIL